MPLDGETNVLAPSKFDFPVALRPLWIAQDREGNSPAFNKVPSSFRRAVVRTDTDQILGTVGSRYHLTPHSDLIEAINTALAEASLPLTNLEVRDHVHEGGAKIRRELIFKDLVIEPQVDDLVHFKIDIFNSYNEQWAFQHLASAERLWCLNGCTNSMYAFRTYRKHTRTLSIESEAAKLQQAVQMFEQDEVKFRRWTQTKFGYERFEEWMRKSIAKSPRPSDPDNINKAALDQLLDGYKLEQSRLGDTLWGAYNTLTAWSTHVEANRKTTKVHDLRRRREAQVASALNHPLWKELAEA